MKLIVNFNAKFLIKKLNFHSSSLEEWKLIFYHNFEEYIYT